MLEGPVRHEPQADAARVEGLETIDSAEQVGEHRGHRPGADLGDEDLVDRVAARRRDLAAAPHQVLLVGNGLEAPAVAVDGVAHRREVDRHRLQAALEHQRAGHAGVVLEVAGEVPVVGRDRRLGAQVAASPGAAARVEVRDLVEEQHAARGDLRRPHVRARRLEAAAEAVPGSPFGEGAQPVAAEGARLAHDGRRVERAVAAVRLLHGIPEHAGRARELLVGEEAGLSAAHGEAGLAAHPAVVVKEEQPHLALVGVAVDVDVVDERVARPAEAAVVGQLAAEQAVDALAAVEGSRRPSS